MAPSQFRIVGLIAAAAIVAGACASTGATATTGGSTGPDYHLIKAGTLTICSDTSYPPQESLDASNNAVGSDIDLAKEIAKRLGNLKLEVVSTVFDTIIPALQGGQCDIIVSAQTITAERLAAVDMVPYFAAGQSFVVLTGNPSHILTIDDLCGKALAAEKGTIEADHVQGTGSGYDDTNSLDANCVAKGKAKISLQVFDADTAALAALQAGTVVAHFTDEPVAGYEVAHGNGQFQVVANLTLERGNEGIAVPKSNTVLREAIRQALHDMIIDGTYATILNNWGVGSGAITVADLSATPAPVVTATP